ncbi:MAG: EAL domain-containing protein [Alphaproteobacteria bacterium]
MKVFLPAAPGARSIVDRWNPATTGEPQFHVTLEAILPQTAGAPALAHETLCAPVKTGGDNTPSILEISRAYYETGKHTVFDTCTSLLGLQEAANTGKFPVTLNISVASALDPGFFQAIDEYVQAQRLNPEDIIFEILEHDVDPNADADHLQHLKRKGYRFALDDFGTGTSRQNRLTVFGKHVDFIKVDGPFIRSFLHDSGFISPYDRQEGSPAHCSNDLEAILTGLHTFFAQRNIPTPSLIAERPHTCQEITTLTQMGFTGFQSRYMFVGRCALPVRSCNALEPV